MSTIPQSNPTPAKKSGTHHSGPAWATGKLVSIGEAAAYLGVSIATLRRWSDRGTLHPVRPDGKNRLFYQNELDAALSSKPMSISEAAQVLGLSVSTLRRLEKKSGIVAARNANGERLYSGSVLKELRDYQKQPPVSASQPVAAKTIHAAPWVAVESHASKKLPTPLEVSHSTMATTTLAEREGGLLTGHITTPVSLAPQVRTKKAEPPLVVRGGGNGIPPITPPRSAWKQSRRPLWAAATVAGAFAVFMLLLWPEPSTSPAVSHVPEQPAFDGLTNVTPADNSSPRLPSHAVAGAMTAVVDALPPRVAGIIRENILPNTLNYWYDQEPGLERAIAIDDKGLSFDVYGAAKYVYVDLRQDGTEFVVRDNETDVLEVNSEKNIITHQGSVLDIRGSLKAGGATGDANQVLTAQGDGQPPIWQDTGDILPGKRTTGNLLVADGDSWESVAMSGDATITAGGVVSIGDDKVVEADLKAVDAAADEECLTYETTTGDFEWQSCGSGGGSQNLFETFAVSGQSNVVADGATDTLTLVAGANVTITTDASTDSITIASADTNTTYTAGNDLDLTGTVFSLETTLDFVDTINLAGTGTLNGLDAVDATGEDTIEALIFDSDAENISGVWEVQDDVDFVFGNDANWAIQYDEAVDDQLLFVTTGTAATATTDPLFEILVGATPTADQQVFGVAKGSQSSNTALFTVDEDGDTIVTGDLTISGDDLSLATNTDAFILVADGTNFNPVAMSGDITITNAGVTAIGADKVTEADLKAVDTPADEECLTFEATVGDFEWQTCSPSSGGITSFTVAGDAGTPQTITDANTLTIATGAGLTTTAADTDTVTITVDNDGLDFAQFEDTLDLDAALTVNQGTNTWTQSFTGTTTDGYTYSATSLTSGTGLDFNVTNTHTADAAIEQVQFDLTNAQATLANSNFAGLTVNFTNNPTVAGNTETAVRIQNQVTANTTDNAVAALLTLDNADTSAAGSTVVTDALRIINSGNLAGGIVNAINIDDANITTDIVLQNDETIDNNVDGTITLTAGTVTTSSNATVTGDLTITGDDLFMTTNTSGFILVADGTNYNPVAVSGDVTISSTGAVTIGADKVLESHLKAVDAASDEECLTFETTTGDFEWQTCGGAATTTLNEAYGNDVDGSDAVIALTTADDSIEIDNPAAAGTDSTFAFFIDQNDTSALDAMVIDSEGGDATSNALVVTHNGDTSTVTGAAIMVTAENGAGGLYVTRNAAAATTDDELVRIHEDGAADTNVLEVSDDGTGITAWLDKNNTGTALYVDNVMSNTTQGSPLVIITSNFTVSDGNTYTKSGTTLHVRNEDPTISSGTLTDSGIMLFVEQNNAAATGDAVQVTNLGTGKGIDLYNAATTNEALNITSLATTANAVSVSASSLTTGNVARFISNGTDTNAREIVEIINDNTAATGATALRIQQDSTADGLFIDQNGNGQALEIDAQTTTTYAVWFDIQDLTTGQAFWVTGKNTATTNTAIQQNRFDITNAQATIANTNFSGLNVNFTNNPTIAGNTETAMRIQNQDTDNTTDNALAALLTLDNADTATTGSTVVTDALRIINSGNISGGITNAINIDDADITTDIVLQNDETIDNNTDGTITLTAGMVTASGDLTITGDDLFMTTNTSGAVLVADGTNFNPVVMSGDVAIGTTGTATIQANAVALTTDTTGDYVATIVAGSGIATTGAATGEGIAHSISVSGVGPSNITDDSLDFVDFEDIMDLDAATEVNLAGFDYSFDLDGIGDFIIKDAGTAIATFDDSGNITLDPTDGSDVLVNLAAGSNTQFAATAAPTVDIVTISNSGFGTVTNGVDGLAITIEIASDAATDTNSGLNITATASGDSGDTLRGINVAMISAAAGTVYGVNIAGITAGDATENGLVVGSGWDTAIDVATNTISTGKGLNIASTSTTISSGELATLALTSSGASLTAKTGALVSIAASRTETRTTGTTADDYDLQSLTRTSIMNGAGGTFTATGSVLRIENVATPTAGTLTDTVKGIELVMDADGSGDAIFIDSNGTGTTSQIAINIDSESTTADVVAIDGTLLTTGDALQITLDSDAATTGQAIRVFSGASANTQIFSVDEDGDTVMAGDLTISGDDLFMGTNTDAFILVADGTNYNPVAMSGDITITNAGVTSIGNDKVTEADLKAVDAAADEECLTFETTTGDFEWQTCGGAAATLQSTYDADADGSDAVIALTTADDSIEIDNPSSSGTDSAFAFLIDQNDTSGVDALNIDSESTDSNAILITHAGDGTDNAAAAAISVTAESGAGGLYVTRNLGAGDDDPLVEIVSDHASGDQPALFIDNDPTGAMALSIDAENTGTDIVDISAAALTTGIAIDVPDLNLLTTGKGINVASASTAITSGELLTLSLSGSGAAKTGAVASVSSSLTAGTTVTQDYDLTGLTRTSTSNTGGALTASGSVLRIENIATQTAGTLTDTVKVLELVQDDISTGAVIHATNPGTGLDLQLVNTNAGADGVSVVYHHDSASPAAADVITDIDFSGEDSGGNETDYAQIQAISTVVTNGSEDGELAFSAMLNGTLTEAMRIDDEGSVGIGTASPGSSGQLAVLETANATATIIEGTNASLTATLFRLRTTKAGNTDFDFSRFESNNGGDTEFRFDGAGNATADGAFTGGGADLAEYFATSQAGLIPGTLIAIDPAAPKHVRAAAGGTPMIGVISTNPGLIANGGQAEEELNRRHDANFALVGLVGQIPTRVNDENGAIAPGDGITVSTTTGVGRKANIGEQIVGVAMQEYGGSGEGLIEVYVGHQSLAAANSFTAMANRLQEVEGQVAGITDDNGQLNIAALEQRFAQLEGHVAGLQTGQALVSPTPSADSGLAFAGLPFTESSAGFTFGRNLIIDGLLMLESAASIKGSLEVFEDATFYANLIADTVHVAKGLNVHGDSILLGDLTVDGDVNIKGTLSVDKKQAGLAKIPRGGKEVTITYPESYAEAPLVQVTLLRQGDSGQAPTVNHWVSTMAGDRFTISLQDLAPQDITFSWVTLRVAAPETIEGEQVDTDGDSIPDIDDPDITQPSVLPISSPSPTPSASSTPSSEPTPLPSPTPSVSISDIINTDAQATPTPTASPEASPTPTI